MCYRRFLITEFEGRRFVSLAYLGGLVLPSGYSLVRLADHSSAPTCASDRRERRRGPRSSAPRGGRRGRRRAPGEAGAGVGPVGSAGGVRLRFEPIDELLEDSLEPGIVGIGVVADDIDGFAVVVGGLAMIAAGFADH